MPGCDDDGPGDHGCDVITRPGYSLYHPDQRPPPPHNLRKGYLKYLYLYSALADTYLNLEDFPISFILTKF